MREITCRNLGMQLTRHRSPASCILSQIQVADNFPPVATLYLQSLIAALNDVRQRPLSHSCILGVQRVWAQWHGRNAAIKTENARVRTVFRSITGLHIYFHTRNLFIRRVARVKKRTVDAYRPANKAERCDFSGSRWVHVDYFISEWVVIASRRFSHCA